MSVPARRLVRLLVRDRDERARDPEALRRRFDVLTKTKTLELPRYWTTRDRGATRRLFRLAQEVLQAIEAGVFPPRPGWQCGDCAFRGRCWVGR
jgi:hypothetical protein